MKHTRSSGFVALMSAIIISVVLLMIAVTGGLTSFYTRSNVLDNELKDRSEAAADACADQTFLLIANDSTYVTSSAVTLHTNDLDSCSFEVAGAGSTKSIHIQGLANHATTNLLIAYDISDPSNPSVQSWQEQAVY